MSNEFPKWVQRAPDIGPVLCATAADEQKLLADWSLERAAVAKIEAESASAEKAMREAEVLAAADAIKAAQKAVK